MNTRKRICRMLAAWLLMVMTLALSACRSDEESVPPPTNENNGGGHDTWAKVEFIVREGHFHKDDFHANSGKTPILPKIQKFTFELDANKNIVRKDENGKILQPGESPVVVQAGFWGYSMEINYYNAKGERMNSQFVTKEMLPVHQHFFTTKSFSDLKTGATTDEQGSSYITNLYSYTYRDTDPIDLMKGEFIPGTTQQTQLLNDAVGLKGYFKFTKGSVRFDMKIRFAHLFTPKYANNGTWYPANSPAESLLASGTTDFSQTVPFVVVADFSLDGTPESYEKYVKEIADYYKISPEEVKKYLQTEHDESAGFWM
ncbi:hypothetical protein ACF3N7_09820 [Cruoricaptor ignavus]|uniref:hypothetical protein n=1 Tax=Cruoricaptor ignavus TaxID=1118202 RepID=UPI00370D4543